MRLGALLRAAPGRPSVADTAALAMFAIAGCPPLTSPLLMPPVPAPGDGPRSSEPGATPATRSRYEAA